LPELVAAVEMQMLAPLVPEEVVALPQEVALLCPHSVVRLRQLIPLVVPEVADPKGEVALLV
jgi:hypothetical protein